MSCGGGQRLVQRVVRLAMDTFGGTQSGSTFSERLAQLVELVHQLTEQEVGFDRRWVRDTRHIKLRRPAPPMTYVRLVENDTISIGIFIIYNGFRMPLHDHPHMYGLLKVLYGCVTLQSFTRVLSSLPAASDAADDDGTGGVWDTRQTPLGRIYRTTRAPPLRLRPDDAPSLVTPVSSNIHELVADDGPAAFLDILAPPYDDRQREFHCFQELSPQAVQRLTDGQLSEPGWLIRVRDHAFSSDSVAYKGPPLDAVLNGRV